MIVVVVGCDNFSQTAVFRRANFCFMKKKKNNQRAAPRTRTITLDSEHTRRAYRI